MELKRKNIRNGLIIAGISIAIYVIFLVVNTNVLLNVGNAIEGIFGVHSDFDVEIFREGIKTIASGIFVSSFVAVMFYYQEYIKLRVELINGIIETARDICKVFDAIPSFYVGDEEAALKRNFYLESKENSSIYNSVAKMKDICKKARQEKGKKADEFICEVEEKISLFETKISDEARIELTNYWSSKGESDNSIDERLLFLVDEYDQLITKSLNCYRNILNLDLWRLRDLINSLHSKQPISKRYRSLIENVAEDKNILGDLCGHAFTEKDIAERILIIYDRAIEKVAYTFEINSVDIENTKNDKAIDSIIKLQPFFVDKMDFIYAYGGKGGKPLLSLRVDYEVMKYYMENIFSILLYGKCGKYKYLPKDIFIRPAKRYHRGNFLNTISLDKEKALDMLNIYR